VLHLGNLTGHWLQTSIQDVVAALEAKTIATHTQPYPETERQWSVNDIWSCVLGNQTGDWLQKSIYVILAAFQVETIATCSLPHCEDER